MPAPAPAGVSAGPPAPVSYERIAAFRRVRIHASVRSRGPASDEQHPGLGRTRPNHPLGMSEGDARGHGRGKYHAPLCQDESRRASVPKLPTSGLSGASMEMNWQPPRTEKYQMAQAV